MKEQKTIMKLNVFNRKKTALEKLTSTYDIKLDASASQLIMDVLAKLYDNPVEAAIREYVSNAYDANVEAGSTEPVLVNDNAVYLLRTIIKNKQLSSNISMLNLDTKQDTETYLAALHNATRHVEPKTHNLSFDQKVFLAALVSRDRKFLSKKDAKKIIKRLKLLFPDELKLIKDCADEITQKIKM